MRDGRRGGKSNTAGTPHGRMTKFFAHVEPNSGGASACEPVTRPVKIRGSQALAPPENFACHRMALASMLHDGFFVGLAPRFPPE
jgi:hypothetical protein